MEKSPEIEIQVDSDTEGNIKQNSFLSGGIFLPEQSHVYFEFIRATPDRSPYPRNPSKDDLYTLNEDKCQESLRHEVALMTLTLFLCKCLIACAVICFYCTDVYLRHQCRNLAHAFPCWDMAAFGLCLAGVILCIVELVIPLIPVTWLRSCLLEPIRVEERRQKENACHW